MIRFMRASEMTMPSATGKAPPERPVPAPRATKGTALARADADDALHLGGRAREARRAPASRASR